MDYEAIRAARLRRPFQPFFLKTTTGRVFFVGEAERLAVARHAVVVVDHKTESQVLLTPADVEAIVYTDEPMARSLDGH